MTISTDSQHFPDGNVITPYEAEAFVQSLKSFSLDQVASPQWMKQRSYIDKLNLQAHQSAQALNDEFVVDLLLSFDKVKVLISELLVLDTWISTVFSSQIDSHSQLKNSPKTYFVLFHLGSLTNLLECVFYNKDALASSSDLLLDFVDFCTRMARCLTSVDPYLVCQSGESEEVKEKLKLILYSTAISCLHILRFITEAKEDLPLSLPHYFYTSVDLPCLAIELLEQRPWVLLNREKKVRMTWNGSQFQNDSEPNVIHKVEATLFLILFSLFSSQSVSQKYEITSSRRDTLIKVTSLIKTPYYDQLPILNDLRGILDQLQFIKPDSSHQSLFMVAEEPDFCYNLSRNTELVSVAKSNLDSFFGPDSMKELVDIADVYSSPSVSEVLERPKCAECGVVAKFRCSRCKIDWYCDRDCQKRSWPRHKYFCKKQ
ncbi:hypothetical protein GEMRC1_012627 [Eukaryota sp. GEM-RC1]